MAAKNFSCRQFAASTLPTNHYRSLAGGWLTGLNRSVGITAMHSISTISAGSASRFTPINALVGKSLVKYL